MAGKKKQAQLTPEEKLQQALVPEDEQPYKVPANWCWTRQNIACYLSDIEKIVNGEHPYLEAKFLRGLKKPKIVSAGKFINKSSKVILVDGENSGEVFDIFVDGYMGSTFRLLCFSEIVYEQYCRYFIIINKEIYSKSKKGSAIPHLNKELFFNMPFPLPPLTEQQRIVERIESLFAKLDEAKENLQNVLDGFETRKAAILHKAFTGELTANWRKQHGVSMDSWEEKALQEVCSSIYDGDHMPPPKSETGIPFLVISNVNTGYLSFENTRFVPEEYYNSLNMVRKPCKGDVLYTLVGSYGISVIVDTDRNFCFQRHMALLKPKNIDTRYLWYTLQTQQTYEKATKIATGTAQLTVPIKGLRQMEIYVPTLQEQTEIVRIIDNLLAKEQQAHSVVQNALAKIDLIKKSILARAFRGQLATNNPADEPAVKLLERVL